MANEAERRRWNDEGFATGWTRREGLTAATTDALLARTGLEPGEHVLDVGCGSGGSALAAARAVAPGGRVVGVDFSAVMLDAARRRAADAGVDNLSLVEGDAGAETIPEAPFDAAISQFGVLFFDDSAAGLENIRRHLRKGGRLCFSCWQPAKANPWHVAPLLRQFLDGGGQIAGAAASDGPGPFRFGDPRLAAEALLDAGFSDLEYEEIAAVARLPLSSAYDSSMLGAVGVPAERAGKAEAAVERHLAQYCAEDGRCDLPLAFTIWSAVNR